MRQSACFLYGVPSATVTMTTAMPCGTPSALHTWGYHASRVAQKLLVRSNAIKVVSATLMASLLMGTVDMYSLLVDGVAMLLPGQNTQRTTCARPVAGHAAASTSCGPGDSIRLPHGGGGCYARKSHLLHACSKCSKCTIPHPHSRATCGEDATAGAPSLRRLAQNLAQDHASTGASHVSCFTMWGAGAGAWYLAGQGGPGKPSHTPLQQVELCRPGGQRAWSPRHAGPPRAGSLP